MKVDWISTKDRLPELDEVVLINFSDEYHHDIVILGKLTSYGWFVSYHFHGWYEPYNFYISHWALFPGGPEKKHCRDCVRYDGHGCVNYNRYVDAEQCEVFKAREVSDLREVSEQKDGMD